MMESPICVQKSRAKQAGIYIFNLYQFNCYTNKAINEIVKFFI